MHKDRYFNGKMPLASKIEKENLTEGLEKYGLKEKNKKYSIARYSGCVNNLLNM